MTMLSDFLTSLSGSVGLYRDGAVVILFGIVAACLYFYVEVWSE